MSRVICPEDFLQGFLETALWLGHEIYEDGSSGESFENHFTLDDIHPDTVKDAREDCQSFLSDNMEMIGNRPERVGMDFFLTRNRHGSGFWDSDWNGNEQELTKAAHTYGTWELYLGDDGLLHHHS